VLALARLCEQQRAAYSQMKLVSSASQRERCRAIWRHMSSKGSESLFRMFFEAYSMGLQEPKRFASFLHTAVEDWLEYLAAPRMAQGEPRAAAREFATVILAGVSWLHARLLRVARPRARRCRRRSLVGRA
jgi:hypothetical protein